MLALILRAAEWHPSFLIGAVLNEVGANAMWDDGEWLVVEADFGWEYLPFELEEGHPLVRALSSALSEVGIEPRIGAWRAASDAGFLAVRAGIPTLLFGPGHIEAAHRPDEFVELAQVETARDVYSRLLLSH